MTKITILGQESKECKTLKPIEFMKYNVYGFLDGSWQNCLGTSYGHTTPNEWDEIVLLEKNHRTSKMDLMLAIEYGNVSCLYLGHFNDGVV